MIGKNLKHYRKLLGYKQQDMHKKFGVSARTYWSWENNLTEPSASKLKQIADILGVPVSFLVI